MISFGEGGYIKSEVTEESILWGLICTIQLILLIGSILPTEKALKMHFDKNGNRR